MKCDQHKNRLWIKEPTRWTLAMCFSNCTGACHIVDSILEGGKIEKLNFVSHKIRLSTNLHKVSQPSRLAPRGPRVNQAGLLPWYLLILIFWPQSWSPSESEGCLIRCWFQAEYIEKFPHAILGSPTDYFAKSPTSYFAPFSLHALCTRRVATSHFFVRRLGSCCDEISLKQTNFLCWVPPSLPPPACVRYEGQISLSELRSHHHRQLKEGFCSTG